MKKSNLLFFIFFIVSYTCFTQEKLTIKKAITIAIESNYDLKIFSNNVKIAEIESGILNSGYLPRVSANAGINYTNNNQNITQLNTETGQQETSSIAGAITESYNASITAEYTLFDGFERKFNQDKQKGNLKFNELQERQQIENTIISIYDMYYNIAFQTQLVENLLVNIDNSKDRMIRAQKRLKYGQGTKLDELNATVDLNNDSISYASAKRDLVNLKRNFNLSLGIEVENRFIVDTSVVFIPLINKKYILESAKKNNVRTVLATQNILLSELDIKINKAGFLPKITGSGSYSWNDSQNPPETSLLTANESYGVNLGVNLSWNLFDGGSSKTRTKTAKIHKKNREIELYREKEQLKTEIFNAHEEYSNILFTLKAEKKNVRTNKVNFKRTQKQYSLGQITAIEFRQAQINLFNALNNQARAKYDLKIAEVNLQQLGGILIQ